MEAPEVGLEVFSSILVQEYIRLMTAAYYIKHDRNVECVRFNMKKADYDHMMEEPLQAALIGLSIQFSDDILTVSADSDFLEHYENKIMEEVALLYWKNYGQRYVKYISIIE